MTTVVETDRLRRDLPEHVSGRCVVVSDTALVEAGLADVAASALGADVVAIPTGEPLVVSVTELAFDLADRSVETLVAVGGGSVLDATKLAARTIDDPGAVPSLLGAATVAVDGPRVVAIPTTAGTGSEVTRTSVVSHDGRKSWVWGEGLRPATAILAPELTVGLPEAVTVASGLDAFVHCVESVTSRRTDQALHAAAVGAANDIARVLAAVLDAPTDLGLRRSLLACAHTGGRGIDRCGTGIGHAIGHALGSLTSIPHGLAVMAGHRAALDWTFETAADAYAPLGGPAAVLAAFDDLAGAVGLRERLASVDFPTPSALADELAAADHQPMFRNHPRTVDTDDLPALAATTLEMWAT